jgi:hypothetical protein
MSVWDTVGRIFMGKFLGAIKRTDRSAVIVLMLGASLITVFLGGIGYKVWSQIYGEHQSELAELNGRIDTLNGQIATLKADLVKERQAKKELEATLENTRESLANLESRQPALETAAAANPGLQEKIGALEKQLLQQKEEARKRDEEARKRAEAERQKQKRPQVPILSDLPTEGEQYGIPQRRPILILHRTYSIIAKRGPYVAGKSEECIVTVINLATNEPKEFRFSVSSLGSLSIGKNNIRLVLMDADHLGYCMFTYLPN